MASLRTPGYNEKVEIKFNEFQDSHVFVVNLAGFGCQNLFPISHLNSGFYILVCIRFNYAFRTAITPYFSRNFLAQK